MRWKLLIIASLLAAIAGAGSYAAIIYLILMSSDLPGKSMLFAIAALLLPIASVTYATVFVYRHTARRRKLQAVLTTLLSLLLLVAAIFAVELITNRMKPQQQPIIY